MSWVAIGEPLGRRGFGLGGRWGDVFLRWGNTFFALGSRWGTVGETCFCVWVPLCRCVFAVGMHVFFVVVVFGYRS